MIIPNKINLVNQDDNVSCVLACVAMLTGKKLVQVRTGAIKIGLTPPLNVIEQAKLLATFKLAWTPTIEEVIYKGNIYILKVSSLNTIAGQHSIIADCRSGEIEIFDPQNGVKDKNFYTVDNFKNFSTPVRIIDPYEGK